MPDFPIPASASGPAPAARGHAGNSAQRDAIALAGASPTRPQSFQDALARELGGDVEPEVDPGAEPGPGFGAGLKAQLKAELGLDGQTGTALDAGLAAPPKDIRLGPGADPAQTTSTTDTLADAGAIAVTIVAPPLPGPPVAPAQLRGVSSPLPSASGLSVAEQAGSRRGQHGESPPTTPPAPGDARRPAIDPQLSAAAAQPTAAELGPSAKHMLAPPGDGQREIAFNASAPEPPSIASGSLTAIHTASAVIQSTHVASATLHTPLGAQRWDQGLGEQLIWMAGQKHQAAELHLNPAELGPLQIRLTLDNDQASARFVSAHAVVREIIEAAMPRLREMLAESGIKLGDASVSADAFREPAQDEQRHGGRVYPNPDTLHAKASGVAGGALPLRRALGLVDTFA